jgi:hypothetical protein
MLRTFVRNIMDHIYYYFINGLPYIKNQYFILQKYMDLGTQAQIYEAAKELYIMKFNIIELTIKLLSYIFLAVLASYFGSAIHHMLADTPQILQSIL